jgi:ABC-type glycerol-3-phosphate transport system permease component
MTYSSFKTTDELYRNIFSLPSSLNLVNYQENLSGVPTGIPVGQFLVNSVIVSFVSVGSIVLVSVPSGYVLSKKSTTSDLLFYLFLAMIAVPPPAVLVPVFYIIENLGLYDTYAGLILPYIAFNIPFSTILARAFYKSFPRELEDAASIDGLSEIGIFARVVLPLSGVIVTMLAVVNFPNVWNELLYALVLVPTDSVRTIQPGLLLLSTQYRINWGNIFAGLVMSSLPMVVFYIIFQRYLVKATIVGAIKG